MSRQNSKRVLIYLTRPFDEVKAAVFRYAQSAAWQIEVATLGFPSGWVGDGIITDNPREEELDALPKNIPVVTRAVVFRPNVYNIVGNMRLVAQVVVDYFLAQGYKNFAAVEETLHHFLNFKMLEVEMSELLAKHGYPLHLLYWSGKNMEHGPQTHDQIMEKLKDFLSHLPTPCALFSPNITYTPFLSRAAAECKLRIPEDIALLSNGDDPYITLQTDPPTSAIIGELNEIGYIMAHSLDLLMAGCKLPNLLPQPTHASVITRQSTDTLVIENPKLYSAVNFLRKNFANNIGIVDAAEHAGISLTQFKMLMKKELKSSPGKFLKQLRLYHARALLLNSDFSINEIAHQAGYSSAIALIQAYKHAFGCTPGFERRFQ